MKKLLAVGGWILFYLAMVPVVWGLLSWMDSQPNTGHRKTILAYFGVIFIITNLVKGIQNLLAWRRNRHKEQLEVSQRQLLWKKLHARAAAREAGTLAPEDDGIDEESLNRWWDNQQLQK